jgi:hypothetical protein
MARKQITTPRGTAVYPWLNTADAKFGDPKYKCDLRVDASDAEALCAQIEDALAEHFDAVVEAEEGSGKYTEIFKEEVPFFEEDGNVIFRTSLNKTGKNSKTGETWENKIAFFDASQSPKPIPHNQLPKIGGGSDLRISCELNTWKMPETEGRGKAKVTNLKVGISLRIKAVQVIAARQGAAEVSASASGFGGEEGGYSYDPDSFDSTEGDEDEAF